MAKTTDSEVCPPLPSGSVDFNKLHEAAKSGEDLSETVEKIATTRVRSGAATKPAPADAPGAPVTPPPATADKITSEKPA